MVSATLIDAAISSRFLEAVSGEQIALALAAADAVSERRARATRALELQVERARYEADRAERAFHACEPENRLVARSLEQRWDAKLGALAEAEAALAASQAEVAPLPARDELEVLAVDLPRLWNAPTTSDKDRKRLLRTLIADVTLTSQLATVGNQVHVGIRWRSGATEEIVATRPAPFHSLTSVEAVEVIKRLARHTDHEIAAELNVAGLRTGSGQPFDVTAVRWVRYVHRIPSAHADAAPGELTIPQVAARLQVGVSAIYHLGPGRSATKSPNCKWSTPHHVLSRSRRSLPPDDRWLDPRPLANANKCWRSCSLKPPSREPSAG